MIVFLCITIFITIIGSIDAVVHFEVYKIGIEKTKKKIRKLYAPFLSWHINCLLNNIPCERDGNGEGIVIFGLILYIVAVFSTIIFFIIYLVNFELLKTIILIIQ